MWFSCKTGTPRLRCLPRKSTCSCWIFILMYQNHRIFSTLIFVFRVRYIMKRVYNFKAISSEGYLRIFGKLISNNTGILLFSQKTAKTPEQTADLTSFLANLITLISKSALQVIEENLLYLPLDLCNFSTNLLLLYLYLVLYSLLLLRQN